jgi:hypothetical protein
MFAAASPSVSPSPPPPRPTHYPPPYPKTYLKPLGTRLSAYISSHIQSLLADAADHAAELHSAADVEFQEVLDDHRLDITTVKDDGIVELNRVIDEKLLEVQEAVDGIGEHAVEVAYANVCDRLDELLAKEANVLRKERKLERSRHGFEETERRRPLSGERERRAMSLPLRE